MDRRCFVICLVVSIVSSFARFYCVFSRLYTYTVEFLASHALVRLNVFSMKRWRYLSITVHGVSNTAGCEIIMTRYEVTLLKEN